MAPACEASVCFIGLPFAVSHLDLSAGLTVVLPPPAVLALVSAEKEKGHRQNRWGDVVISPVDCSPGDSLSDCSENCSQACPHTGSLCRKGKRGTCLQAALRWLHVTRYNSFRWKNEGFLISTETRERPLAHLNPLCFCPIWALQSTACMLLRDWLSGSYFDFSLRSREVVTERWRQSPTSMLCSSRAP